MDSRQGDQRSLNSELWHACAGPLVSVPQIGSHVVYFPQGHSEQVAASTQKEADVHIPSYPNLPSRLICQLDNVTLHADLETDEVFTRMTLIPVSPQEKDPIVFSDMPRESKQPTDFFCKTLTASDTSTHGGFSIPRRAAEKVFPPLDYTTLPPAHPAQELVARDLHDNEWPFRHIYRGQPRRHLLTTGWSVFVSAKRLQAGDSVLFIRDDKGQLLLGIRRANRQQTAMPSSVLTSDSMHIGVLAAANHAAATYSRFTIFYNPRASPSEFVIPLEKYSKAVHHTQVSVGMRFRMVFETEESGVRRYMGTITGVGDLDPIRWPNSHWRSLKVGWDESTAGERQRRVSLWEIEPLTTPFLICPPLPMRKRPRAASRGQSGMLGEEEDLDASHKRSIWLKEDVDRDSLPRHPFGRFEQLMRPPRQDAGIASQQSDLYRAMAAAALQEFREPPKQILQRQPQQQQQQQQAMQSQQMQFRSPQPQQPPHQDHQPQHLGMTMLPEVNSNSVQIPSNRPHSPLQLPSLRGTSGFPDSDLNLSPNATSAGSFPLHGLLGRTQADVGLASDENQFSGLLRGNQNGMQQQQQPPMLPGPGLAREPQVSNPWFSSLRDSKLTEASVVPNLRMGRPESSPPAVSTFMPASEPVQSGLAPLSMQGSPFSVFRDCSQEQEQVQQDPRSHLLFGVSIDQPLGAPNGPNGPNGSSGPNGPGALCPRPSVVKGKDASSPFPGCGMLPGPYGTTNGPEMPMSPPGIMPNLEDNTFLQRGSPWSTLTAPPVRTFTKVYKLGSVGRSLDVTRFGNYLELRSALARMFGLEGQIEDAQRSTWQIVFVDHEGDVLLLGDDPWEEFLNCVRCIRILSPSEVKSMNQEGSAMLNFIPPPVPRSNSGGSEDGPATRQDHRNSSPSNPNGGVLDH